jgi:hypothetical protein
MRGGGMWRRERNVRMAGNPTDVGHASKPILGMHIEDILDGQGSSKKVTGSGVNDAFRFAGGSGGLNWSRPTVRQGR